MRKSKGKLKNTLRQMIMKTQHSDLWDATKAVLREKFIVIQGFLNKEEHSLIIKRTNQQEDFTLLNIYAPNVGIPKSIQHILKDSIN